MPQVTTVRRRPCRAITAVDRRATRASNTRLTRLQAYGESPSEVAAACGYADQAHMTREWHKLTGVTPAAWLAGEHLPNVQDTP